MGAALVLLVSGCQTGPAPEAKAADEAASRRSGWRWPSESGPMIRPLNEASGRVVQVNERLRFAVVDAGVNPLPPPDSILQVYRDGQAVGELKAGRTMRGSLISADFVAGQPQTGDAVRWPGPGAGNQ